MRDDRMLSTRHSLESGNIGLDRSPRKADQQNGAMVVVLSPTCQGKLQLQINQASRETVHRSY
jgi:hypothetical protein